MSIVRSLKPSDNLNGQFPIGIDTVGTGDFQRWKDRGCNFAVRADLEGGKRTFADWKSAAVSAGMRTIRQPSNDAVFDNADDTLLALALPDEPDLSNHWYLKRPAGGLPAGIKSWATWRAPNGDYYELVGKEQGNPPVKTGADFQQTITVYKAASESLRKYAPGIPIFGNMAGNSVTSGMQAQVYTDFMSAVDWGASDWYPVDNDLVPFPLPAGAIRRYGYHFPAMAMGRLLSWSGGKPQFAYISIVSQRLNKANAAAWRWPAMAEIICQAWTAIAWGASGIIFFSHVTNPDRRDGITSTMANDYNVATPTDIAAATDINNRMPLFCRQLQNLAPFLTAGKRVDISAQYPAGFAAAEWTLGAATLKVEINTTAVAIRDKNGVEFAPCEVVLTPPTPQPARKPTLVEQPPINPVDPPQTQPQPSHPLQYATADQLNAALERIAKLENRLDNLKSMTQGW